MNHELVLLGMAGSLALACSAEAGTRRTAAARTTTVDVAPPQRAGDSDSSPLPKAVHVERHHPIDYFVGTWDGVAMKGDLAWHTVLTVDGFGNFTVTYKPPDKDEGCILAGKLLVGTGVVYLDTVKNTCYAPRVGKAERVVLSKTADEFVLGAPEFEMTYSYSRRLASPDD
jgi:hypothetical protein